MKTLAGAGLGTIVLGVMGDKIVEQYQRTGVFSLLPLSWTSRGSFGSGTPCPVHGG